MKKLIAVMLVLVMIIGCFTACGKTTTTEPSAPAQTSTTPTTTTTTPEAAPSGTVTGRTDLNLSSNKSYASCDPQATQTGVDVQMHRQIYEALYTLDEINGGYIPTLATEYNVSADALTWTFTLREGVKFQNGEDFKASDVVFTMERAMESAVTSSYLSAVTDVKADGDYKVVFTLANPVAAFLNQITNIEIVSEAEVKAQGDAFGTQVAAAGTGPYMLSKYDVSNEWQLVAFPDYWRGEAPIKTVNYTVVTDTSAGLIAFENGELDFYSPAAADLPLIEGNDAYTIYLCEANHVSYIFLNWESNEYLADPAVREAIAHAISKDDMNLAAFNGLAAPTNFMENRTYVSCAPSDTISYDYDPELSKKLLADAGYTAPISVGTITTSSGSYYATMATVLKEELEQVGILVEINLGESQTCSSLFRTQDYDIGIYGGNSQGDYAAFRQRIDSRSATHYVNIANAPFVDWQRMDELWDLGDIESDTAKRTEIYTELNNLMMSTACWLPIFHKSVPYCWNADLNAAVGHTDYYLYDWSWK